MVQNRFFVSMVMREPCNQAYGRIEDGLGPVLDRRRCYCIIRPSASRPTVTTPIGCPLAGSTTVMLDCTWNFWVELSCSTSSTNTVPAPFGKVFWYFGSSPCQ